MTDWVKYPHFTNSTPFNPYLFDSKLSAKLFHDNQERLFVSNDETHIKVVEIGVTDHVLQGFKALDDYLARPGFKGTRLFLIPQEFSWGKLKISADGIKRLFHHIEVFPVALDVVCTFGQQISATSDSLGCCHSYSKEAVSEFCYLTKTVEEHGREETDEPWSIRQMGVYHQRNAQSNTNNFIIFNPTQFFQQRFKDAQKHTSITPTWHHIHNLVLSHSTWQWRQYLSYWETRLQQLITKAQLFEAGREKKTSISAGMKIEYSDVQNIQVIHDKMSVARFILDSNSSTCGFFLGSDSPLLLKELAQQSARAANILDRSKNASTLMQDILSFGGLEALRISNKIAEEDNKIMVELATKSQKDAQVLKKITILTMIYLPAALVSQFLSMGYLKVNLARSPPTLIFESELLIFAVLTTMLFALTLALWLFLEWPGRLWTWWRWRTSPQHHAADEEV